MKRALSMLVAIAMILSMVPSVFAASETATVLEDVSEIAVSLNAENEYYAEYSWTPSEDGELSLYQYTDLDIEMILTQGENTATSYSEVDGEPIYSFAVSLAVVAGEEVIIEVINSVVEAQEFTAYGNFVGLPGKSQDNPISINELQSTVTNTGTLWYQGFFSGTTMTITGEGEFSVNYNGVETAAVDGAVSMEVTSMNPRMPVVFALTGEGEFSISFAYPVGTQMNPEVIFRPAYISVNIAEGNNQGYFYKWTSNADGELKLTCPAVEGVEYDVNMTNMSTYAQAWLQDSTDGTITLAVSAGDEVIIQVAALPDESWNYPALQTGLTGEFTYPLGSMMNPEVVENLSWYYGEAVQAEGDTDGYYYSYTAPADGNLVFYFGYNEGLENYVLDIIVTNQNTYAQKSLLNDGVDNYGMELQLEVSAGDELIIQVVAIEDAEGKYAPAATMSWCGNFAYPVGTEQNPIVIEWAWDEDYANATATVTVPAGKTLYYNGQSGMDLLVDGVESEMDEAGVFALAGAADAETTYELALKTPVGAYNNPEVIEAMPFEDANSLAADESYYYIWNATEKGTVTLTVSQGANLTVDKLTYVADSEWPISEQFVLAEPEIDENWNYIGWIVGEKLVVDVEPGQQLKIQVNALTDWSTWTTPAVDYTVNASFESSYGITEQPQAVNADSGENAIFTVTAKGEPVSYKWEYRRIWKWFDTEMTGYNTNTLTVPATGLRNGYDYRCVITYADGTQVISEPAELTVNTTITIISNPNDQLAVLGTKAQFSVEAVGESLKYQWEYKRPSGTEWFDTNMEGSTKATVYIETTEARDGYLYRCKITDAAGAVTYTEVATMTVLSYTEQPADVRTAADSNAVFTVATNVAEGFTYQWQYRRSETGAWNNTTMTGYNTATLTVAATVARDGYQYRCIITGARGGKLESKAATLHVGDAAVVTAQPENVTAALNANAVFTVGAENALSYQWQYSKNGTSWLNTGLSGYDTATLTVPVIATRNGYQYRCVITGTDGDVVYSNVAVLTIG